MATAVPDIDPDLAAAGFKPAAPAQASDIDPDLAAAGFKPGAAQAPDIDPDLSAAGFKPGAAQAPDIDPDLAAAGFRAAPTQADTENRLAEMYAIEQAETLPQKAGKAGLGYLSEAWNTAKNLPALAKIMTPGAAGVVSAVAPGALPSDESVLPSIAEAAYQLPTGLAKAGAEALTYPLTSSVAAANWLYDKATGAKLTPAQKEQKFQDWKLDHVNKYPTPGYAQPVGNSITNAPLTAGLGTPDPALVNAISTASMMIPFGGAAEAATGGAAANAAKLKNTMLAAMEKAAPAGAEAIPGAAAAKASVNEALKEAGVTGTVPAAPGEIPPVIPPTPPTIPPVIPPSVAGKAAAAGPIAAATETLGSAISGAGAKMTAASKPLSKFLNWAGGKGDVESAGVAPWIKYYITSHVPILGPVVAGAVGIVKGLEKGGALAEGLGDLMERLATADRTDPEGIWANAAENAPAGHWMKALVKNPAVKVVIDSGTLGANVAKNVAISSALGAGIGVVSGGNAQEIGESAGQMAILGVPHGMMSAGQAKIFDANIGGAAKVVADHFANGGSAATLRLVPASDILTAATLKKVLPDRTIKFATDQDAGSAFAPGGKAVGQAGWYDKANKTLWIDPTKRAPGGTLIHEAFHPIFDELVAQHPDIKATLDQALKRDVSAGPEGKTIDHFKLDYANRVSHGDPYAAANYIKREDAIDPDWGYSEMLSEAASHALDGKDLLQAMQGKDVQQSATQTALAGVKGWLSDQGVDLTKVHDNGTIFPDFKGSFNDPNLRQLTYRLLKAQRDMVFNKAPGEAPEVKLTAADMGGPKAPWYNVTDKNGQPKAINPWGERVVDRQTGKESIKFYPPGELRRRTNAEETALAKYFPDKTLVTKMPAGLMEDPAITPWTKQSIKTTFDSIASGEKISFWNHGIAGGKSAVDRLSFAKRASRDLGNVPVSYQRAWSRGIEKTSKGNFIDRMQSEEAEDQLLAQMKTKGGLGLWGGDMAKAKADLDTLKNNHAAGLPGDANGLGTVKRDILNKLLTKTFRSFRLDRREGMTPEPSEAKVANWEKVKANFSPASEGKRNIELTGPDGKKYPASFDGVQETLPGMPPWLQITPKVDLPGATAANSTTYAHSLAKLGYKVPDELWKEIRNEPLKFSASDDPHAIKSAAVKDEKTGRIYEGASHYLARMKSPKYSGDLIDGYTTNTPGEFLDRDKAFARAVEAKQYQPGESDRVPNSAVLAAAGFKPGTTYGLTSERFNEQNPNRPPVAPVKEAVPPAGLQSAIKWKGKIYTSEQLDKMPGATEFDKLRNKGVLSLDDWVDVDEDHPEKPSGYPIQYGYVNKKGVWTKPPKEGGTYSPAADESENKETLRYPMEMAPGKASGKLPGLQSAPYDTKLAYQQDMLKAMQPLFDHFKVKPGEIIKGTYKNSAGETEHNPVTNVDLPAADAKLFGLLHGHFADQEAVAAGFKETSPGNFEPESPHSFYETGHEGTPFADKIKALGPEAQAVLDKLQPEIGPAVEAVNAKWDKKLGLQAGQFSAAAEEEKEPTFYSQLGRVVDAKFSGEKMPAAQLSAILRNPSNGVKSDELKWSGLDDFLKGKQRVTKAEVQEYLKQNDLTPQETVKTAPDQNTEWYPDDEENPTEWILVNSKTGEEVADGGIRIRKETNLGTGKSQYRLYVGYSAGAKARFETLDFAKESGLEYYKPSQNGGETSFGRYVLEGQKTNYREILFHAPEQVTRPEDLEHEHWGEESTGVIAHARVDDRTDTAGKTGLFAEEIQSDWHQQGKKYGYLTGNEEKGITENQLAALQENYNGEIKNLIKEGIQPKIGTNSEGQYSTINFVARDGKETVAATFATPTGLHSEFGLDGKFEIKDPAVKPLVDAFVKYRQQTEEFRQAEEARKASKETLKVPEAPFKHTWQETVFRRLVQMAAEEGKDWIGWTTGKQQADRYSLEKHVTALQYNETTGNLSAHKIGGVVDWIPVADGVTPEKLENYVGKEVAQKLLASKPDKNLTDLHTLSGVDLKVGGEGMSGFYDKIMVDYANKFGKKFGARVTEGTLGNIPSDEGYDDPSKPMRSIQIHTLPITPEMKASVSQGVALFSPAALEKTGADIASGKPVSLADKEPGQPIAIGTFSPPAMSGKEWEALNGKKMLFVMADQQASGGNYKTASGRETAVPMMGGPGYPNMPETQGKAGWALTPNHLTRITNALKNVDYIAVVAGSPDMSSGSISFARAYLEELEDALKAKSVKPGNLNRLAREAGRKVKDQGNAFQMNLSGMDFTRVKNFDDLKNLVLSSAKNEAGTGGAQGLPFWTRSEIWKYIGSATNSKKFGVPPYEEVRDRFNEPNAAQQQGQIVQIIQVNKNKPLGTAEEHGVPEHPSYSIVIPGTGLGAPAKPLAMEQALKPWFRSREIAAKGGTKAYKVMQHMPQTTINPRLFKGPPPKAPKAAKAPGEAPTPGQLALFPGKA
jgi:hypothetical protein